MAVGDVLSLVGLYFVVHGNGWDSYSYWRPPHVGPDLDIHLLIAAAVVLSFRFPAAWSFVLLTKVTPAVGVLWFAFRREWRSFAIAIGGTAAIVAVSVAIGGIDLWVQWAQSLAHSQSASWTILGWLPLPAGSASPWVSWATARAGTGAGSSRSPWSSRYRARGCTPFSILIACVPLGIVAAFTTWQRSRTRLGDPAAVASAA